MANATPYVILEARVSLLEQQVDDLLHALTIGAAAVRAVRESYSPTGPSIEYVLCSANDFKRYVIT
jgi:hypothetical protein